MQREAFHVGFGRVLPLGLVPSAPHDPLSRLGLLGRAHHLRHDLVPRARFPQVQSQAKLAQAREVPVPLDEARIASMPCKSMTLVPGPIHFAASASPPSAAIRSPRTAMALGRRLGGAHGDDLSVPQHQVRGLPEGHGTRQKEEYTHGH